MADDIGASTIGPERRRLPIATPSIDSIAAGGVSFGQAYGAPLCVPARISMLTGRYPQRYGIYANQPNLPSSALTIAERLRTLGYRTALVGKWQAGGNPLDHGFDSFLGFIKSGPPYIGNDPNNPLVRNRTVIQNTGYVTDVLADEAVQILRAPSAQPRLLVVTFTAAHEPLQATPELLAAVPASIPEGKTRTLAAVILGLDRAVGRILAVAKPGTWVMFMGDNGEGIGLNSPLRGGKEQLYEGGIRIPMALARVGQPAAPKVRTDPVSLLDVLPTVVSWAGGGSASNVDGRNLLGPVNAARTIVFSDIKKRGDAIRQGRWKLLKGYDGKTYQLYDLVADRGEKKNLASSKASTVRSLERLLTATKASW